MVNLFTYPERFGFNSLTKISWLVSVAVILILTNGRPNKDFSRANHSVAEWWVPHKYWRRPQKQTSTLNNLLCMKKCIYQENVFFSNKTIQDTALWHIMIWSTSQSQTDQEIWELYGDEDRPSRIAIKNYDGIRLQVTVSPAKNKILKKRG